MNEEKFTGKADLYDKYRPSYPRELIDWLYDKTKAETVADIGAGTGKFTLCLTAKPWKITAVEPNDDMRSKLKGIEGITAVKGSAEETGLEDGSVDLVTAAQAFHWFDREKFKTECKRIINNHGNVAVIYNERAEDLFMKERDGIFLKFCGISRIKHIADQRAEEVFDMLVGEGYFSSMDYFELENNKPTSMEEYVGRELSCSYALKNGNPDFEDFKGELESLFKRYEKNGVIIVNSAAKCYLGKF